MRNNSFARIAAVVLLALAVAVPSFAAHGSADFTRFVAIGLGYTHSGPIGLQLVCDDHGDRGSYALTHFGAMAGHRDSAVFRYNIASRILPIRRVERIGILQSIYVARYCRPAHDR